MTIKTIIDRWETSDTVTSATNWLSADVSIGGSIPVKHTFQFMVPTATVVNLVVTRRTIAKTLVFNGGTALPANTGQQFGVVVWPGTTYNIQHDTGTQNVSVQITESDNLDL